MRILLSLFTALFLASCGVPLTTQGTVDPFVYDAADIRRSDKIAIFIPGTLASINIFDTTEFWEDAGYARVMFRYPGLDDLPLDHRVSIPGSADQIAAFANEYPGKDIALVAYSTGGPVALLAASQMTRDRDISITAMSTAVEYGGGVPTALRGLHDIALAMAATGSVSRAVVWKRFWAGLLYGPAALDNPAFDARIARDVEEGECIYIRLDPAVAISHALALPNWELPDNLDLTGVRVGFFVGLNDRVFSTAQTVHFADQLGGVDIYGYPDHGHLLFFTRRDVFHDMLRYVQGRPVVME